MSATPNQSGIRRFRFLPRMFARLALLLSLVLVVLVMAVAIGLSSTYGAPWFFAVAERMLPRLINGELHVEGVTGGLMGDLHIDKLVYDDPGLHCELKAIDIRWVPRRLRDGVFHVEHLRIAEILALTRPKPLEPAKPLVTQLPVDLLLDQLQVAKFSLRSASDALETKGLEIAHIALRAQWLKDQVTIQRAGLYSPEYGALGAAGRMTMVADHIIFKPLVVRGALQMQVEGTLGLMDKASDLTLTAQALRWPLQGKPQIVVPTASGHFTGLPAQYQVALNAKLISALPTQNTEHAFDLKTVFTGTERAVAIESFALQNPDAGSLTATGSVKWQPTLQVFADVEFKRLNPGLVLPDFSGLLNGRIKVTTTLVNAIADIAFDADLKQSTLRKRPFLLKSSGLFRSSTPAQLTLTQLELQSGGATVSAAGQVLPLLAAKVGINAPNLGGLWPGLRGALRAKATLNGPVKNPSVIADATAQGIRYRDLALNQGALSVNYQPEKPSRLQLTVGGLTEAGRQLSRGELLVEGLEKNHRIALRLAAPEGAADLTLAGAATRQKPAWDGQLLTAVVKPSNSKPLTLQAPAKLQISADRQALQKACFLGWDARACADIDHHGERTTAQIDLSNFSLANLNAFLPENFAFTSAVNGSAYAVINGSTPSDLRVDLAVRPGEFTVPQLGRIALQSASLKIVPDGALWRADVAANTEHGVVKINASIPQAGAAYDLRPITANAVFNLPSLSFLQAFIPNTSGLVGQAEGTVAMTGSLKAPKISTQTKISNGALKVPTAGLDLQDIRAEVRGNDDQTVLITGSLRSGDGTLTLNGTGTVAKDRMRADFSLKGNGLTAVNLPDIQVHISPDVQVGYSAEGIKVRGEVRVPKANIAPRKLSGGTVAASNDTVVLGREQPIANSLPIDANVRIVLGDDVQFSGFGLKTQIVGAIDAIDAPGLAGTRGRGELRLVGAHYKAYGQDLKLSSGRIIFNGGPISDPSLDLRAYRKLREDLQVDVHVRGRIDTPFLELSSTPSMTREEQLSWLLLGRPLTSASSADRDRMSAAALSLGLGGGNFLADKLGKPLGLDDVSLGAEPGSSDNQARFTVGKYLSPKLYVSYGIGLFQPGYVFRLLYDLGGGFKLRTESGVQTGGDLLYSVER